jgi:hypothetical protein
MSVTNYDSMNGQLRGQSDSGGRLDYLVDAIGSVTGMVDETSTLVSSGQYKPFGADEPGTTTSTSSVGWRSSTTFIRSHRRYSDYYQVQRSHYSSLIGLFPSEGPRLGLPPGIPTRFDPLGPLLGLRDPLEQAPVDTLKPDPGTETLLRLVWRYRNTAAVRCGIIVGGVVAVYEIATYEVGRPTGPWTRIGQNLADALVPMPRNPQRGDRDPLCDDNLLRWLTERKKAACERPGQKTSCNTIPPPSPEEIKRIIGSNKECMAARIEREYTCFNGGNETHQAEIKQLRDQNRCCNHILKGGRPFTGPCKDLNKNV